MEPALDLRSLVLAIESSFSASLTGAQARVAAFRAIASRLAEDDAWRLWSCSVWTRGHIVLRPIFAETWSRQRLILAIAAAREAIGSRDGDAQSALAAIFKLDPKFDAALDRALMLVPLETYEQIGVIVDQLPWSTVESLESLADLRPPSGADAVALIDRIHELGDRISGLSRANPWSTEIVA